MPTPAPRLVLASTSHYRRTLLERLGLQFEVMAPDVEEAARPGEPPHALALRLALAKAAAVARLCPDAVVIGSDQVAALGAEVLGKPGTAARARAQLAAASGRRVRFHTSVAIVRPDAPPLSHTDLTEVAFRALAGTTIAAYVERDQPLDCAGSFRSEGLGIALIESIETRDPTALVGLPLIFVAAALSSCGLDPLGH